MKLKKTERVLTYKPIQQYQLFATVKGLAEYMYSFTVAVNHKAGVPDIALQTKSMPSQKASRQCPL